MSDQTFKRLRVLHLVGGDNQAAPNPLLLPLLTRGNRQRVESHVVQFVRGSAKFAVVRQSGVPVHELPLSAKQFSVGAVFELKSLIKKIDPDLIHAWGSSAQVAAVALRGGGKKPRPIVWSIARTTPLSQKAGFFDKLIFSRNKKRASQVQRIVYPSAAAAAQHRRAGLPEEAGTVISPGVDAERFKPDLAARQRVRQQLELPADAVVVGMYGPFQPEFDHGTLLKAVGELIRSNPHMYCVLAGRGMVRGNAPLMAMVGGGTLGTRTRVIGEWSDLGALFNACDVVCSSATTDVARLALAMSMLCGTMCVATGMGAQGEVVGSFGVAVEPGSPDAMSKGIRRILEMPPDRHAFMSHEARKHAWQNFNNARSIDKYHELYIELVTGESVKLTSDKPPELVQVAPPIIKSAQVAPAKAEPEQVVAAEPVIAKVVAPEPTAKPDTLAVDLDSILSTKGDALAKGPDTGVKHSVEDNVMEWSEDDAKLIENVIVDADPADLKVVEPKAPIKAVETKVAETKAIEKPAEKSAAQRLLEARRAELQRSEANLAIRKPAPQPVAQSIQPKPGEIKPDEIKISEAKPIAAKPVEAKSIEAKPTDTKPADTKPTKPVELKLVETKPPETKLPEQKPPEQKPPEQKQEPKPQVPTPVAAPASVVAISPAPITPNVVEPKLTEATVPVPLPQETAKPTPPVIPSPMPVAPTPLVPAAVTAGIATEATTAETTSDTIPGTMQLDLLGATEQLPTETSGENKADSNDPVVTELNSAALS